MRVPKQKIAAVYRVIAVFGVVIAVMSCTDSQGEREFDDVSVVGLSPDPADMPEAIVQVFAARGWETLSRAVSVHTWIAFKVAGDEQYTVMETSRWRPHPPALKSCRKRRPDRRWHGASPQLLAEIRGDAAERAIPRIRELAEQFPMRYGLWPGPNSNTFTAYIIRNTPELRADLPPTAIGKDYLVASNLVSATPSGTGYQFSLLGLLGLTVAVDEGIEGNFFGLVFGVDFNPPALKLPLVGRIGMDDGKTSTSVLPLPPECRCGWPPERTCKSLA